MLLRQAVATSGPRPGTWQSLRLHWQFWALAMGSDSDSGPAVSESAGGCHHFILCMLARFSHLPGIAAHIHLNASHFLYTLTIIPPSHPHGPPHFCTCMNSLSFPLCHTSTQARARTCARARARHVHARFDCRAGARPRRRAAPTGRAKARRPAVSIRPQFTVSASRGRDASPARPLVVVRRGQACRG